MSAADLPAPLFELPPRLAERLVVHAGAVPRPERQRVVYWMRAAQRLEDNPALEVAGAVAEALGRPLLVYQGLSERYRYASDRIHRFVLEGARSVQAAAAERGLRHAFHLERPGHDGPVLRRLAETACLVVADLLPVEPLRSWTRQLAGHAPLVEVDASCIVPVTHSKSAPQRAFAFRERTETARAERIESRFGDHRGALRDTAPVPFEELDLLDADLRELIAACRIDHAVAPVPHFEGGAEAGWRRWEVFKASALARYARHRNDPLRDGTSRLSPWLHFGQISPFRLAREASSLGAEKFLDELLVWRELAWHWCFHSEQHEGLAALPAWARETLARHAGDPRDVDASHERLARARSEDPLWDAAQASLLRHGWLHNNVRMTWGKAFAGWTRTPERALAECLDLNNRYALDGRDPSSYGGILWAFGLFDRPFEPEREVLGVVRPRSPSAHARRMDVETYSRRTHRAPVANPPRIAVVGGGLSGAICARTLLDHGLEVAVFDKGRGPGGRTSTRRTEDGGFDHGAQYFTARDERFHRWVRSWEHEGVVARWEGAVVRLAPGGRREDPPRQGVRWVGRPGMNAVVKHLLEDLRPRFGARLQRPERVPGGWRLHFDEHAAEEGFEVLVLALPAPQARELLAGFPAVGPRLEGIRVQPCLALMARWEGEPALGFDGAFCDHPALSWIARDGSKPGRTDRGWWVLHSTAGFAEAHLEEPPESWSKDLLAAFSELVGDDLPPPAAAVTHRWRHALPVGREGPGVVEDLDLGLWVTGDWCRRGRVEDAFLAGQEAAGRVLSRIFETRPGLPECRDPDLFG